MADIELVIKIPEDVYTRLFDNGIQDNEIAVDDVCEMARAIRKGTPLPKGHGRLIDADYLREDFKASKKISFAERMDISCIVDHAPTIIEANIPKRRKGTPLEENDSGYNCENWIP